MSLTTESSDIKIKCDIQQHAAPWAMQIDVPHVEVAEHLDLAWNAVKERIPASGFRPGSDALRVSWESRTGLVRAYGVVWTEVLHRAAGSQKKFILDIVSLDVAKRGDGYRLVADVFFTPEVTFLPDSNMETVPVEVYSLHPVFIAQQVDQLVAKLLKKHRTYESVLEPVRDGMKVQVVLEATLDGEHWDTGSGLQHIDEVSSTLMHPVEFYHAVLGKNTEDNFEFVCESMPNIYGPNAGKRFVAKGKVLTVEGIVVEKTDTVLQRAGFQSEEDARLQLTEQTKQKMLKGREDNKFDLALHYLRTHSKMAPIPVTWLRQRTENEYTEFLARNKPKSEREVLETHGAKTKNDVIQQFISQAADLLRGQMTLLAFAAHHGTLDYGLSLEKNAQAALQFLFTKVTIVEVDPVSVRAKEVAVS